MFTERQCSVPERLLLISGHRWMWYILYVIPHPALNNGHHTTVSIPRSCALPNPCVLCVQVYLSIRATNPNQQKAARGSGPIHCTASTDTQWGIRGGTAPTSADFSSSNWSMQVCEIHNAVCLDINILRSWCRLPDEISALLQKEVSSSFLKLLFTKNQRISRIDGYYRRIGTLIQSFQVRCHVFHTTSAVDINGGNTDRNTAELQWMADKKW